LIDYATFVTTSAVNAFNAIPYTTTLNEMFEGTFNFETGETVIGFS